MSTIVFIPFPEFGHLNPTLKLARTLKQAGHRVIYLGMADFEEYVKSQGLEFVPILENSYPKGSSGMRSAQMKIGRIDLIRLERREMDDQVDSRPFKGIEKELEAKMREIRPDLLIIDYLIGGIGYKMAYEFGIPSALLSVTLLEGAMLGEPAYDPHHPELPVLVLCPEEFEFRDTAKKPNRYYIEPSVDLERKELYTFPWQDVNAVRPLIYCSLGSESHLYKQSETFFRAIIEAMRDKPDWQLVLATGPFMDPRSFDPVPENVLVVSWAPQLELIEKASIVITHGGLGGVKECILLGVPMIVFPCKWDQPFNAARVVAHGLGVRGNISRVSAAQIKAMIETIANNPSFQSRVDSMSKVFRDVESSGRGVNILENIITDFRYRRNGEAGEARSLAIPNQGAGNG